MANLSTVQDHLETLKSGTPDQKKQKLTPESIADVRTFIADERTNRPNGTNYSLEPQFHEWEDLIKKFEAEKGVITTATANATAATSAKVGEAAKKKTPEDLQSELNTALAEFSEKDFTTIRSTIEKATTLIEGFEKISPEYREAMRGALGLMLLERFAKAGYQVSLQGNRINITGKPENAPMATQIETYLRTQKGMDEILALGMIYRSSEIKRYSEIYLTDDKKSIKPEAPRNYLEYIKDAQGKSSKLQNPNDRALEESRSTIESILSNPTKVKGIIIGTPFLATALETVASNPALQQLAGQASNGTGSPKVAPASGVSSGAPAMAPSAPANMPDWKDKPAARFFGEIGATASAGLGDLMAQPHMLGGVIIASIAAWIFGGWKAGLGTFAGAIGLSGLYERLKANGFDPNKAVQATSNAASTAGNAVAGAVTGAATAAGINTPAPTPANAPALSKYQDDLRKKVGASGISTDIDNLATMQGSKYPGKLDDYLKFIESDLKDIPLSKLFPSDHKKSIFFDNFDADFSVDSKLSGKMLKKVLREYLTGNQGLTGTGDKLGTKEESDFLALHNISLADIQSKNLSQILESVHKVRTGGVAPAPTTATPAPSVPATTPSAAPALTKHKIGGVDINVGQNVQTNIMTIAYGADGKEYMNHQSKLPKDKNSKFYIPKDDVVRLGSNIIKINGVDHVEVKHGNEKVYVWINHLK